MSVNKLYEYNFESALTVAKISRLHVPFLQGNIAKNI